MADGPQQQFLLTPEQDKAIDGVLAKHQRVTKADDGDPVQDDALRENIDVETGEDAGGDEGLDARSLAALKAVYRILQPFKGQISEDMVDDVLAELDLDGTGEDGQDSDEDDIDGDDADDSDDDGNDDDSDTPTEDGQAMADDKLPEEFKKADTWSPSKPDGMSDEDFGKAVAAAKSAFNNIGKKADNESDDDGDDDDGKVSKSLLAKLSPEHAALVRKSEDARYEAIAKAAALESRVAKMEGERILKAHEDDIRKDCIILGKDPAEQARILKSQFDANKEAGEQYRSILRDTAKLTHQSGIFKSVGVSHNSSFGASVPSDGQGSPKEQMDAMLRSVVQKGEAADEAAAWAVVMKSQRFRDLYELDRKGIH